jgi:Peptidase A4 family
MNRPLAAAIAIGVLLVAVPGRASGQGDPVWVTTGWAGYVVRNTTGQFSRVEGTWTQPRVVCNRPGSSASFWVGLGGASSDSTELEQLGVSTDCDGGGRLSTSAWFELFPSPPVDLPVRIHAGDVVSASVSVTGAAVRFALANRTTGSSFSGTRITFMPETDSAEWIVEAPAACFATCTSLPLADFTRVRYVEGWTVANGHRGSIGDGAWMRQRLEIGAGGTKAAGPTSLRDRGSSFAVVCHTL